ncbi:MAG: LysR substrate-binding domain-containing protein [Polyangiaceae bacterium]|nr:LysR substrate-binding domain-containing protein [Polyangiaceae bacterium]
MNFDELRMFCAVVDTGSVTAAAARLRCVPSNVTTRIHNLETALGTELFTRQRRRLQVSAAGERLLPYARKILALNEEAMGVLSPEAPAGALRLGSMEATAASRLPPILGRFHRSWPRVRLSLKTGTTGDLIRTLREGVYDAVFVDLTREELHAAKDLASQKAFEEELLMVAPGRIDWKINGPADLRDMPIIVFGPGCSYRRRLVRWYVEHGAPLPNIIEMNSYHGILACVAAGTGISLVPTSIASICMTDDLTLVKIRENQVETRMVWKRAAANAWLGELRALLRQ